MVQARPWPMDVLFMAAVHLRHALDKMRAARPCCQSSTLVSISLVGVSAATESITTKSHWPDLTRSSTESTACSMLSERRTWSLETSIPMRVAHALSKQPSASTHTTRQYSGLAQQSTSSPCISNSFQTMRGWPQARQYRWNAAVALRARTDFPLEYGPTTVISLPIGTPPPIAQSRVNTPVRTRCTRARGRLLSARTMVPLPYALSIAPSTPSNVLGVLVGAFAIYFAPLSRTSRSGRSLVARCNSDSAMRVASAYALPTSST